MYQKIFRELPCRKEGSGQFSGTVIPQFEQNEVRKIVRQPGGSNNCY
jgi:hypothetical protein